MQELDILANNLANTSSQRLQIRSGNVQSLRVGKEASGPARTRHRPSRGSSPLGSIFRRARPQPTGNPSDIALVGKGFLAVRGSSGTLYTRNGSLKVTSTGDLVAAEDRAVLDAGGNPVKLDPTQPYQIDQRGA